MASYESLIKEILPYVPGCPDSVVEANLRSATIEFCEKTKTKAPTINVEHKIDFVNLDLGLRGKYTTFNRVDYIVTSVIKNVLRHKE